MNQDEWTAEPSANSSAREVGGEAGDVRSLAARMLAVGVSTLGGAGGTCIAPTLRPTSGHSVAGPAFGVRCAPGDNLAIHAGVVLAPEGSVLVIDAAEAPKFGYWGEVLTAAAQVRRLAGVVIDGSVRDIDSLVALRFPVFATGVAAEGTTKNRGGEAGSAVVVGGVTVNVGDWIVGDCDGVVALPRDEVAAILDRAEARVRWESDAIRAIRSGATTIELFDLDVTRVQVPQGVAR